MAGSGDILGAGAEFHCHDGFGDHRPCIRSDNMDAQYTIARRIGQYLDEAIRIAIGARAAIGSGQKLTIRLGGMLVIAVRVLLAALQYIPPAHF